MALHINRPTSTRFIPQVRGFGCRLWRSAGRPVKSLSNATAIAGRALIDHSAKRARVIMTADWYDPCVIVEMRKP